MLKNRKGMTIADMTVGLAIGAILVLGVTTVLGYIRIYNQKAMYMSESRIASSLGSRFMWLHFKNADPSYNNLRGTEYLDDNGRNFFDLYSDADSQTITGAARTRTVTLTRTGRNSFTALVVNMPDRDIQNSRSPTFFADPVKFYNIPLGTPPAGPGAGPTVDMNLFRDYINTMNPNILTTPNKIVEVFSPITIRPIGAALTTPPNAVSYFLRSPDGNSFVPENFAGAISNTHPSNPGVPITSFDHFLKTLPSSGGGIPPLAIRSVRLIKYELVPDSATRVNPVMQLRYSTWNGSAFVNPVVVSTEVESLVITRRDIADPMISVDLKMIRKAAL